MDMENLQRIVKNISNEIVHLKKSLGEGPFTKYYSWPPFKTTFPPTNQTSPPIEGINIEDFMNAFKSLVSKFDYSPGRLNDGKDDEREERAKE